jgi:hypothetical protein
MIGAPSTVRLRPFYRKQATFNTKKKRVRTEDHGAGSVAVPAGAVRKSGAMSWIVLPQVAVVGVAFWRDRHRPDCLFTDR